MIERARLDKMEKMEAGMFAQVQQAHETMTLTAAKASLARQKV